MKSLSMLLLFVLALCLLAPISAQAVAPTPDAIAKWKAEGVYDKIIAQWQAFQAAGGDGPSLYPAINRDKFAARMAANADAVDTLNVPVILVDFSDKRLTLGSARAFDSVLFSRQGVDSAFNTSGSMTEYYLENSYGKLLVRGHVYGPYRMPQTYAWYVGTDNGLTLGSTLAYDAVTAADPDIDYTQYVNNTPGRVDGVIIIHAGAGGEQGGADIWSHRSSVANSPYLDGVLVRDYTLNPEIFKENGTTSVISPIGVYCHEFGHILGRPICTTPVIRPVRKDWDRGHSCHPETTTAMPRSLPT